MSYLTQLLCWQKLFNILRWCLSLVDYSLWVIRFLFKRSCLCLKLADNPLHFLWDAPEEEVSDFRLISSISLALFFFWSEWEFNFLHGNIQYTMPSDKNYVFSPQYDLVFWSEIRWLMLRILRILRILVFYYILYFWSTWYFLPKHIHFVSIAL